jgi:phosphoglycolate phosphatase-like HAD superfamily hydrolase
MADGRYSVVVMDVDNTLYDWLAIWHAAFRAMLDMLAEMSGVDQDELLADFKAVHVAHGTTEYPFAIQKLPSLVAMHPGEDLGERYRPAFEAYRRRRGEVLRLYPCVAETLRALREAGCVLAGCTDSMEFCTAFRLRALGLDLLLDYVYCTPNRGIPADAAEDEGFAPPRTELRRTVARQSPPGLRKPNPRLLLHILEELGADRAEALYVGDSPMKDVPMAQAAGVTDVWAKYGSPRAGEAYEMIRRVTHWTDADIQRESTLAAPEREATHILERTFDELLRVPGLGRWPAAFG